MPAASTRSRTVVSNHYAWIVLQGTDPRMKDGLTAQANVIVGQIPNVLVVPNSAVRQGGKTGLVTVVDGAGQKRQVQVQLGMSAMASRRSSPGLREGQEVVTDDSM